jgi:long-chain acyl-CoA synthetase
MTLDHDLDAPATHPIVDPEAADRSTWPRERLEAWCLAEAAELTVPMLLARNAKRFADSPALTPLDGSEPTIGWGELRARVLAMARGLEQLGLEPGGRMLISLTIRPEHWVVDLAAVQLGGLPSSVYATLATPQLAYLARHSRAQLLVVQAGPMLDRWRPVLADLPDLRAVVVVGATGDDLPAAGGGPRVHAYPDVLAAGAALHAADPDRAERAGRQARPHDPVTLLYTSGTTGTPKGVVLSHHNVLNQAVCIQAQSPGPAHPRTVAYLPLAHVAERLLGVYVPIYRAGHVHLCDDPTRLLGALTTARPVQVFGVPRVWEKMTAGLQALLLTKDEPFRTAFSAATELAQRSFDLRSRGEPLPAELTERLAAADAAILRPIRASLGLDQALATSSGAAPIPVDVLRFMAGLGIDLLEVWGMTETAGAATVNTASNFRLGSVGQAGPNSEIRIAEDGEILVRSPLVALGYLREDGGIDPIVDDDGWLATGDVGSLDADEFLTITDRKTELIITAAGKNVAPAQVENLLRLNPLIGQAIAIGDRRPYLTALIVLDDEIAPGWAAANGVSVADPAELAGHPVVVAEIQRVVDAANAQLARPEQIKRFRILASPWTPESGELTPTLKLRRRVILDRHAAEIESLYSAP